jgi:AAA+ superfamily predicted ATPase
MALLPSSTDRLGELTCDPNPSIYLEPSLYKDIEEDVIKVLSGEKNKTGALLYGKPGNGKTQFTKYLARKYRLPIYVIYLNPEYNNLDLAMMFASIPPRCIVLMEDFDNYFNKRTCIIKNENVRFTFDAIINALDGIHNDYQQVIFMMTANDITKIDPSIKERRSRFQFIKRFGPPSDKIRMQILQDSNLVKETKGLSLDQVFARKKQ